MPGDHGDSPGFKRFEHDLTSPLDRAKDPEGWRWRRKATLREVIKGPATPEDWDRANDEYRDLRRGYSHDDSDGFGY